MLNGIGEKVLIAVLSGAAAVLTMNHNDKKIEKAINNAVNKATDNEEDEEE